MILSGVSLFLFLAGASLSFFIFSFCRLCQNSKNTTSAALPSEKLLSPPNCPIGIYGLLWAALRPSTNLFQIFAQIGKTDPLNVINIPWPKLRVLIINDLELGKELFQSAVFSGRPNNKIWHCFTKGNYGIGCSSGKVWEEQRRFTMRKLREAGLGNKSMEDLIDTEVEDFIKVLEVRKGQVMSPNHLTPSPILNTIWVILTGQRFRHDDPESGVMILSIYKAFVKLFRLPYGFLTALHESSISFDTFSKFPSWLPIVRTMEEVRVGFDNLRNFASQLVQTSCDKRTVLGQDHGAGNFIEDYLMEIEATTNQNSTFYKEEGLLNLKATICDLFIAGGETASGTLSWSMLHLIRNPKVQLKIQAELDRVVGRERRPALSDRPNCPYLEAFLWETLRVTPASVVTLPHVTTEDARIGQYFVPKHTTVLLNMAAIHLSPKIWGADVNEFRPERFLTADGSTFVKNSAMIAFSIGKRKCPGDQFALGNLFLFVGAICQKFTLTKDPNLATDSWPPLAAELSGINSPKPFNMIVEEREDLN